MRPLGAEASLLLFAVILVGCGRAPRAAGPGVEVGAPVKLAAGEAFHFVDHYKGGKAPKSLPLSSDGSHRIVLDRVRVPVLCVPVPYTISQEFTLRGPAVLKLGLGRAGGRGGHQGIRFTVRVRAGNRTTILLSKERRGSGPGDLSPVSLPLPASDSSKLTIELATEPVGGREGSDRTSALALWVNPVLSCPAPEPRPNIVLVAIDALRADHIGCYGYARDTTPFLDSLASTAVLFQEATSQATWTMPSFHSLLTSSYRLVRGARIHGRAVAAGRQDIYPVAMPVSLQGELRKDGYTTLACVGGGLLDPALGFDAGFDWYWSPHHAPMLTEQLATLKERLSADAQQPFFLLLHTYEVHNYFQGSRHSLERFDRGYKGPLADKQRLNETALTGKANGLSSADLQYIRDLYDGEIYHTDQLLRSFFGWLSKQPWARPTIFIVTADHGESLGERGLLLHGSTPYRWLARVPLIVHFSDGRWGGREIESPVALSDLMPTLLDLAGAPTPAGLVGRSLRPLLEGKPAPARSIFCESRAELLMARQGTWWYISSRGERDDELYRVDTDPGHTKNLAKTAVAQLGEMRRVLAQLTMQAAQGYRLVIAGARPQPLTVELQSSGPFSQFDVPTARPGDKVSVTDPPAPTTADATGSDGGRTATRGQHLRVELQPGDEPHVILFDVDPADLRAEVSVSARLGSTPITAARFHLGRRGLPPDRLPVVVRASTRPLMISDAPPVPARADSLDLWLWLPTTAAQAPPTPASSGGIPEELRRDLRALGYLR